MPDFLRWLLNAAKPGKPLPPGEFVWSPAKHFLFRKCPRAWFFRHYQAQGGWNELSADPAMHAYLLKYLVSVDAWMGRTAENALSGALQDIMQIYGEDRVGELEKAFKIRTTSLLMQAEEDLTDQDLSDPKRTVFLELYYDTGEFRSASVLTASVRDRFQQFFHACGSTGLLQELAAADALSWRLPPEYRLFPFAGVQISLRPWLYSVERRTVRAWSFRFAFSGSGPTSNDPDAEKEELDLPERVFAAWCFRKYPDFEVEIRKITFTPAGLIDRTDVPAPVSEDLVVRSADEMIRTANHPGGLKAECFPRLDDPEGCARCRFRELCCQMGVPPEREENPEKGEEPDA